MNSRPRLKAIISSIFATLLRCWLVQIDCYNPWGCVTRLRSGAPHRSQRDRFQTKRVPMRTVRPMHTDLRIMPWDNIHSLFFTNGTWEWNVNGKLANRSDVNETSTLEVIPEEIALPLASIFREEEKGARLVDHRQNGRSTQSDIMQGRYKTRAALLQLELDDTSRKLTTYQRRSRILQDMVKRLKWKASQVEAQLIVELRTKRQRDTEQRKTKGSFDNEVNSESGVAFRKQLATAQNHCETLKLTLSDTTKRHDLQQSESSELVRKLERRNAILENYLTDVTALQKYDKHHVLNLQEQASGLKDKLESQCLHYEQNELQYIQEVSKLQSHMKDMEQILFNMECEVKSSRSYHAKRESDLQTVVEKERQRRHVLRKELEEAQYDLMAANAELKKATRQLFSGSVNQTTNLMIDPQSLGMRRHDEREDDVLINLHDEIERRRSHVRKNQTLLAKSSREHLVENAGAQVNTSEKRENTLKNRLRIVQHELQVSTKDGLSLTRQRDSLKSTLYDAQERCSNLEKLLRRQENDVQNKEREWNQVQNNLMERVRRCESNLECVGTERQMLLGRSRSLHVEHTEKLNMKVLHYEQLMKEQRASLEGRIGILKDRLAIMTNDNTSKEKNSCNVVPKSSFTELESEYFEPRKGGEIAVGRRQGLGHRVRNFYLRIRDSPPIYC